MGEARVDKETANEAALEYDSKAFSSCIASLESSTRILRGSLLTKERKQLVSSVSTLLEFDDYATKTNLVALVTRQELSNPSPGTSLHHLYGM